MRLSCISTVNVCAEFYDKAADLLREHASELPALSERLRRFLALGSGLALMRARRAWATHEASNGAAGIAVACLQVPAASGGGLQCPASVFDSRLCNCGSQRQRSCVLAQGEI